MPDLLLNLRQVPADEASEVRELLSRHAIDFYETTPSQWGISHGGIWLVDDHPRLAEAKALLKDYQAERRQRAIDDLAAARERGDAPDFWRGLRDNPLRVVAALAGIVFMLLLVALPVLLLR